MCGLMSDLVICKLRKSMVIHDSECPYRDQVSLNNTNPTLVKYQLFSPNIIVATHGWLPHIISYKAFSRGKSNLMFTQLCSVSRNCVQKQRFLVFIFQRWTFSLYKQPLYVETRLPLPLYKFLIYCWSPCTCNYHLYGKSSDLQRPRSIMEGI